MHLDTNELLQQGTEPILKFNVCLPSSPKGHELTDTISVSTPFTTSLSPQPPLSQVLSSFEASTPVMPSTPSPLFAVSLSSLLGSTFSIYHEPILAATSSSAATHLLHMMMESRPTESPECKSVTVCKCVGATLFQFGEALVAGGAMPIEVY